MALGVFLRGVNVGGNKKFQPSVLAKELARLRVVNIGATGTFVVHGKIGAKALREEIRRKLPFEAEIMICTGEEIMNLVRSQPFGDKPPAKDVQWYVSILQNPPRVVPRLPMIFPANDDWELRIFRVTGKFALSIRRRLGPRLIYPIVLEETLGIPVTTRNWNTIISVCNALQEE